MSQRRPLTLLLVAAIAAIYRPCSVGAGDEWQPISPEELKMTGVPEAPGAPAVILFRQVDRDDSAKTGHEYNYIRTKILTEEGRKYADVEIPYSRGQGNVLNIRARTVHPDGSIVNFEGKAFDKTIVKAKGLKILAKTFTMPDVQVGSIVEYHYMYDMNEGYVYNSEWVLSEELFTKFAKFSLVPNKDFALGWSWPAGLPVGAPPPQREPNGVLRMTGTNIPAFVVEDYMPPENELKFRIEFTYTQDNTSEQDPTKFWKKQGKKYDDRLESFVGKHKAAAEQAVAQIVAPSDSPEAKLNKIYARVEQIHNTSFDLEKTEEEEKRLKEKEIANVEDVLKHNRGDARQVNWTMVALARAAGFEAYSVYVSARSQYFFHPELMNTSQLNADVVLVKVNGKDVFCDPGAKYAPLGLLPWYETGVRGLRLDKDGGTWIDTPVPESADSRIERKADLKLQDDGSLAGKLTVTFTGLEALWRRTDERNEDDTERKKFLEEEVREYIPVGIEVELTNKPDWNSASPALVSNYDLKVPGWASAAGRRALLSVGLFSASEKQLFEHADRVYPIYFHFPYERVDDITIDLPLGWHVSSVPKNTDRDAKAALYEMRVENNKDTLHLSRVLRSDLVLVGVKFYPSLRAFYQVVRTGDEQQIIVQPGVASAGT